MIKIKSFTLGVVASLLLISGANSQGRLGERHVAFGGGYERITFPEGSFHDNRFDGAFVGADLNVPLSPPGAPIGFDLGAGSAVTHVTNDDLDLDFFEAGVLFRGYVPAGAGITPYAGAGLTWTYFEASASGFSYTNDTFSIPVTIGVEFVSGKFSIRPFYRYALATESREENTWSIGGSASWWFSGTWGMTAGVKHSDLGHGVDGLRVGAGAFISF